MKRVTRARWVRSLALASLACVAFEACTSSSIDEGPQGAISFSIVPPSSTLACDDSLIVSLTTDATLRPPNYCGTTANCGSVSVSLLETEDGAPLIPAVRASTADVQLDLSSLVSPPDASAPTLSQVHFVKAEMFGDLLAPYPAPGGGTVSDIVAVSLSPSPSPCATGAGGEPGASGATGSAGAAESGANAGGAASLGSGGEGGLSGGEGGVAASEGGVAGQIEIAAGAGG